MTMLSYEVVRRAIEFDRPERLPMQCNPLGIPSDVHSVGINQIGVGDLTKRETYDEWGCCWVRTEVANMGQVKRYPLESWDNLSNYEYPDADDPALYEGMERQFKGSDGKYVRTGIFMLLFERMWSLRGMENILIDLYSEQERARILADKIVEYNLAVIHNISERFPERIHGFGFSDDWGTQRATFISPRLWRQFFKPRYARIFETAHRAGWHVWMHSDGKINEIIDDLIDIGLDVINLPQPRVLGIEEIGRQFRGRICFESLCDSQLTLTLKAPKEIRDEAKLLLENWATEKGGFILARLGGSKPRVDGHGIEVGKKRIMVKAFQKLDPYRA